MGRGETPETVVWGRGEKWNRKETRTGGLRGQEGAGQLGGRVGGHRGGSRRGVGGRTGCPGPAEERETSPAG